jgi:hypothetical protein
VGALAARVAKWQRDKQGWEAENPGQQYAVAKPTAARRTNPNSKFIFPCFI